MRAPMRFDELPAAQRRLKLLEICASEEGLWLNCDNGLSTDHADVRWLLRKAYIKLGRSRPGTRSRMTKGFTTPSGNAAHRAGKF